MPREEIYDLKSLAARAVEACKREFPSQDPEWESDWWVGFKNDWDGEEFHDFIEECKRLW